MAMFVPALFECVVRCRYVNHMFFFFFVKREKKEVYCGNLFCKIIELVAFAVAGAHERKKCFSSATSVWSGV